MIVEDAIQCINQVLNSDYYYDESLGYQLTSDDFEWLEMAKESLNKRVPQRPVIEYWLNGQHYHCPTCNAIVYYNRGCANNQCGQMILWEEEQ